MDYSTNNTTKSRKNKHLNYKERTIIEIRLKDGWSVYKIAKELGRTINTVSNEIKRGTVKQIKQNKEVEVYYADSGSRVYESNRKNCGKKFKMMVCIHFIEEVQKTMKVNKQSIDAVIGTIVLQNKYKPYVKISSKPSWSTILSSLL